MTLVFAARVAWVRFVAWLTDYSPVLEAETLLLRQHRGGGRRG